MRTLLYQLVTPEVPARLRFAARVMTSSGELLPVTFHGTEEVALCKQVSEWLAKEGEKFAPSKPFKPDRKPTSDSVAETAQPAATPEDDLIG